MSLNHNVTCILNTCPDNLIYFKEEHVSQCINIPTNLPNINEILDVFINNEIIDTRLLETKDGISYEGQKLTGYKLVVQVKINVKITYVSDDPTQNICAFQYEILKSIFIIIPYFIEQKNISDMFKSNRIAVNSFIEHTDTRQLDCRMVNSDILILLDARIC